LPRNVELPEDTTFRIELWDRDTAVSADPAGAIQRDGLPETALPDAIARLTLDNLGTLSIVASAPHAQQGVGLRFEVRPDALVVLDVERYSPAFRAGILKGDRIVAIGPQRVSELSGGEAASDLSLANDKGSTLTIADQKGQERQVTLDKGFIWLVM
jgi:C-terminal processing protease CtpA/Prc